MLVIFYLKRQFEIFSSVVFLVTSGPNKLRTRHRKTLCRIFLKKNIRKTKRAKGNSPSEFNVKAIYLQQKGEITTEKNSSSSRCYSTNHIKRVFI